MKSNGELERRDIAIDPDLLITEDGKAIEAYIEAWFDVDKKFGTKTKDKDATWVNVYADYNPVKDSLRMEYIVEEPTVATGHKYVPTRAESDLIKQLITEKIWEVHGQTPKEFLRGNA